MLPTQDTWITADEQYGGILQSFCGLLFTFLCRGQHSRYMDCGGQRKPSQGSSCIYTNKKMLQRVHQHEGESILTEFHFLVNYSFKLMWLEILLIVVPQMKNCKYFLFFWFSCSSSSWLVLVPSLSLDNVSVIMRSPDNTLLYDWPSKLMT